MGIRASAGRTEDVTEQAHAACFTGAPWEVYDPTPLHVNGWLKTDTLNERKNPDEIIWDKGQKEYSFG